ncbi:aspartyl protease family protein [Poriferisphaera sp. WC338]|uniref:aspartyl protease family protein n=1 Tax=Poriferisphaera sp. WC338 TaxID=3425129 RepID=UPI003D81800C
MAGCHGTTSIQKKRKAHYNNAQPAPHSMSEPSALPAQLDIAIHTQSEHIFVRADLDGRDAGMFLLDTGAAIDAVGKGIAGRFNLPEKGSGTAMGIAGAEKFKFREIDSLQIGDLELDRERLAAINLNRFANAMGVSVNGVIGYSSLKHAPFTIDYPNEKLTIYRPNSFLPPTDASAHHLLIRQGLPLVKAQIANGEEIWLIVDSGADQELTLPMKYLNKYPKVVSVPMSGAGQSAGVGGKIKNIRTWLGQLTLLGVELKNVPVSFEDSPALQFGNNIPIGRIGHRLLENFRITFHTDERLVYAEWQPNRIRNGVAQNAGPLPATSHSNTSAVSLRFKPNPE